MRRLLVPLVALALAAPACSQTAETRGMSRVRIPDPGLTLSYRLEPGTALTGHLRLGQTRNIDGLDKPLSQAVECDVTLVVAPKPEVGAVRLSASFTDVDLAWGLPPTSSFAPDAFRERALTILRSFRGWIEIDERGRVVAVSPLPDRTPAELAELLGALLDTVEASFVPAPTGPVMRGAAWEDPIQLPPLRGTTRTTLEGLYHHKERDESVALLKVSYAEERETPTESGTEKQGRTGEGQVLYSTKGGYVAEIDRELSRFAPSHGMTYEKLRVKWTVLRGMPAPTDQTPTNDVQMIGDPCNPDYVGPEVCKMAPPEPPPEPEPASEPEGEGDGGEDDSPDAPIDGDAPPATSDPETSAPDSETPAPDSDADDEP